jgi:3'-5' exoribonuclease
MARRYINQLSDQEAVDEIFLATQKQLRPNRMGNLYLQVELCDRTGTITARMWNATEQDYRGFEPGDYVRVEGTAQLYQGAMQVIATSIHRAAAGEVDEGDFRPVPAVDIDSLRARLARVLRGLQNPHLRNLAECFLKDEAFMAAFARAPAGIKNHHAYLGGLLEHVVHLIEVCGRVAACYPEIDGELLTMGAFLHDVGKIAELAYDRGFAYTDEGQLVGHVVMGVAMLEAKAREAERLTGEALPGDLLVRLKHMIVSHHGQYEFGSPKLPMTLEALALAYLDDLDAKLHNFSQLMREDPNVDSAWTMYHPLLGRKLYKGGAGAGKAQG